MINNNLNNAGPQGQEQLPAYQAQEPHINLELAFLLEEVQTVEVIQRDARDRAVALYNDTLAEQMVNVVNSIQASVNRIVSSHDELLIRLDEAQQQAREALETARQAQDEREEALLTLEDIVEALGANDVPEHVEEASNLALVQQIVTRMVILRQRMLENQENEP